MNKPCPNIECCCPGDREDNLWVTINDYQPPKTQDEWESSCFLDKCFHGYYKWPRLIKYPMNKRDRYTKENMPEHAAIIYRRFMDPNFVHQLLQFMIVDQDDDENIFDINRFRIFKVNYEFSNIDKKTIHRYFLFQGLFRNFGMDPLDHFMEQLYQLIHEKSKEKQEGSHRVAAEIVAGMIRGSKYWTLDMVCFEKNPSIIYSLDKFFFSLIIYGNS